MLKHFRAGVTAVALALSVCGTTYAGTVTWSEAAPTSIYMSAGSVFTWYSSGSGTDILSAQTSAGGNSYFSASAQASATFNYVVTWTPTIPGETVPRFGVITFDRYAQNSGNISGSCAPSGNANATTSSSSTSSAGTFLSYSVTNGQYFSLTTGSQNINQLPGSFSFQAALAPCSGNSYMADIAVSASASGYVSGSASNGGSGGNTSAYFKQVATGASVIY